MILGAGTAGTMLANKLRKSLDDSWEMTIVDQDNEHHYQPGYLFVPFKKFKFSPERAVKPRDRFLPKGVRFLTGGIHRVDPGSNQVVLKDGTVLAYDWLIIATGTTPRPERTPGLTDERIWRRSAFDFYTLEGATALRSAIESFEGGKLVVHLSEMPIKCPVAPLEFALLAEDHFRRKGIRHKVDITYVTPLDGAFTKPVASKTIGNLFEERSIRIAPDFVIDNVDPDTKELVSYDGRRVGFDLLVSVPVNMGAQFVIDSGLGDDLGFIPVDKHTLRSDAHENIFVVGDATNVPTSKAGAVAHFQADHFIENFSNAVQQRPMTSLYDGHANCFVESGRGKAMLLDFNYDTEPLTGTFPYPVVGPLTLLGESRLNHLGKLAFEQIYWRLLLPGHPLPVPTMMSMSGKNPAEKA